MAVIDHNKVEKIAKEIRELPLSGTALTFTDESQFPPVGDTKAIDYFFAVTMHDYGFWIGDDKGYIKPLYAEVNKRRLKGSDFLWNHSMQLRRKEPDFFKPENLSVLSRDNFYQWLSPEHGFQDLYTRWKMTLGYASYCVSGLMCPEMVLGVSNRSSNKLRSFMELSSKLPGYNGDLFFKKNLLLAMILSNRPEKFLDIDQEEKWPPLIDYHLMRVSLRLGLIKVSGSDYFVLSNRLWANNELEEGVRQAVYDAVSKVIELSGKPMNEIDFLLWNARKYCPEMEEPECSKCVFDPVCAKRTGLFQPVYRTTNY